MARLIKCFRDFSGGLCAENGDNMGDDQLLEARNIIPGLAWGWSRAEGTVEALSRLPEQTAHRAADLLELQLSSGQTELLAFSEYAANQQDLYRWAEATESWQTVVSGYQPKLDRFTHAHKLYWLTGTQLVVYDGTDVTAAALTPAGDSPTAAETAVWSKVTHALAVEQRGQRWFYATADNEIIFSEIGDPTRVTPTNIINVEPGPGDRITALKEFSDGLLIFLRDSVYYLAGWDLDAGGDLRLTRLNVSSGTRFPRSVQVADNSVLYLGRDGVYELRIGSGVSSASETSAAENISRTRVPAAALSGAAAEEAWSAIWNNAYHLSLRYADGRVLEYRWYPRKKAFFGPYDHGARSYSRLSDNRLYLGLTQGLIVCLDPDSHSYLDPDGSERAISVRAVSKGFDLGGAMCREVKIKKVLLACRQFLAESSGLTVHLKSDYHDVSYDLALISMDESLVYGEGLLGDAVWGWKDVVTKELPLNRRARRVTLTVSDDTPGQPLVFYGVAFLYRLKKVRAERSGVVRGTVDYDD